MLLNTKMRGEKLMQAAQAIVAQILICLREQPQQRMGLSMLRGGQCWEMMVRLGFFRVRRVSLLGNYIVLSNKERLPFVMRQSVGAVSSDENKILFKISSRKVA